MYFRMVREKLSELDRKQRNREYQRKRRAKIYGQANLKEEFLISERLRWKKRVEEGKLKNINDMTEKQKKRQREAWKQRQRISREHRRKHSDHLDTPEESPFYQALHEPAPSRQYIAGARKRNKQRKMKALKAELKAMTKDRNKMRKRYYRELAKNENAQSKKTRITKKKHRRIDTGKPAEEPLHQENPLVPQCTHSRAETKQVYPEETNLDSVG